MAEPDWYRILEVEAEADDTAIRAAHRRKARDLHPDVNPAPDATARMAELNRAREVLLDPQQRAAYDRLRQPPLSAGPGPFRAQAGRRAGTAVQPGGVHFSFGRDQKESATPRPSARRSPWEFAREAARWRFDPRAGAMQEDWYRFLDVRPWSTSAEVQQACRRLAPEATSARLPPAERERRAAKLRLAAETLCQAVRKQAYDATRPPWRPGPEIPDYYALLRIRPQASAAEVAEAVTGAHLSLGAIRSTAARAKDAALREAHWVLRDPARRAAYDAARKGRRDSAGLS